MNVKQKLYIRNKKKELVNKWYELVKPLGEYISKREEKKYQKIKSRITEEQAVKWFAESIINYIIRYPNETFPLVIATWIHSDYHWGYHCIADYSFSSLLKKQKYKTAFYKFDRDLPFQEKVVDLIKAKAGMVVEEKVEDFSYTKPKDYQKTYFIKLDN